MDATQRSKSQVCERNTLHREVRVGGFRGLIQVRILGTLGAHHHGLIITHHHGLCTVAMPPAFSVHSR